MYTIRKDNFVITFNNEKKGLIMTVSDKDETDFYALVKDRVYKLVNGKWEMIDTENLRHVRKPTSLLDKAAFDLIVVPLHYPIKGKYLKLKYDQILFLQALAYDLANNVPTLKNWIPGNDITFTDGELTVEKEGWIYTYNMPHKVDYPLKDVEPRNIKKDVEEIEEITKGLNI